MLYKLHKMIAIIESRPTVHIMTKLLKRTYHFKIHFSGKRFHGLGTAAFETRLLKLNWTSVVFKIFLLRNICAFCVYVYCYIENSNSTNLPGRFCKFSKNLNKNFNSIISPQLRISEKRTIARWKGLVLGFNFGQISPCRRAPHSSELHFLYPVSPLRGCSAFRGACSNTRILLGFVAQGLVVE